MHLFSSAASYKNKQVHIPSAKLGGFVWFCIIVIYTALLVTSMYANIGKSSILCIAPHAYRFLCNWLELMSWFKKCEKKYDSQCQRKRINCLETAPIHTWIHRSPFLDLHQRGKGVCWSNVTRRSSFVTGWIPVITILVRINYMCCVQCFLLWQDRNNFICTL